MSGDDGDNSADALRLDKWLWHARFLKSRTLAGQLCQSGKIRLNSEPISKSHQLVRPGDVLTFPLGQRIRIVRIVAIGSRRGPATEAQALYEDMSPPLPAKDDVSRPGKDAPRESGSGRPTKVERRAIDKLMGRE